MRANLYSFVRFINSLRAIAVILTFFFSTVAFSQCELNCPPDTETTCGLTSPEFTGYATLYPCSGFGQYEDYIFYNNDCTYTIVRTWSHIGLGSCVQYILVIDNDFPVFTSEPLDLALSCDEPLPALGECPATDGCDSNLEVDTFIGGSDGTEMICELSTAVGPGPDWAFHLEGIVPGNFTWIFQDNGHLETYGDGTAHLWGTIINPMNPNQGFDVNMWFENGMNWDQWSALGRSYKDDLGVAEVLHFDWEYYELANNFTTLNGIGEFEGSQLFLSHYPFNYYFGFQCGIGANNKNLNNGLSGWFVYTGLLNGNWVEGAGDLNVDKECIDGCGNTTVTYLWRAEDDCGHVSFADQLIVLTDNEAPVVDFENPIELPCENYSGIFIQATDNCSDITITYIDEIIVEGCNGIVVRHYQIVDDCGNATSVDQTIHLYGEDEPYFISFPEDILLSCENMDELPSPNIEYAPGCGETLLSQSEEIIAGSCEYTYDIIYTFTLTDDCGNVVSQQWTISIADNEAPQIINVPDDVTIGCGDAIPDAVAFALDNCDPAPTISVSAETIEAACGYQFIRTWVATDICGNTTSVSQVVSISDEVQPVFTFVPADVVIACDVALPVEVAVAIDDCSDVTITWNDEVLNDCAGSIIRHFIATDGCGNMSSADQLITRVDNQAPQFNFIPADLQLNCSDEVPFQWATATDNCSEVVLTYEDVLVEGDCAGSFERWFHATDGCGNISSMVQTVVKTDTTEPVFVFIPADIEITCEELLPTDMAEASDDCSIAVVTSYIETVSTNCPAIFRRHFIATDACGNTADAVQEIVVVDEVAPEFSFVPENVTMSCDQPVSLGEAEATDNCSEIVVTYSDELVGDCAGSFIRTFTATDLCGNTVSAQQSVTILDETAPQFTSFPEENFASCESVPTVGEGGVAYFDNCSAIETSFTEEVINGDCPGNYTILRTWNLTDECGNATSATWVIHVADNTPPVLYGIPEDVTLECGIDEVADVSVFALDNCSGEVNVSLNATTEIADCGYYFIRTWTAIDECGNVSTASQTAHFDDTINPYWLWNYNDTTISCDEQIPPILAPPVLDACDNDVLVFVSEEIYPGSCPNEQQIFRIYRAYDDCGNYAIFAHSIFVVDEEEPDFLDYPSEIELSCTEFEVYTVSAEDNCGEVTLEYSDQLIEGESCGGTILRTYSATDECGNTALGQQVIHLVDNDAPVILNFPEDVVVECDAVPSIDEAQVEYTDNCSSVVIDFIEEYVPGDCINSYTLLRTWTLSDNCDNSISMTWTIEVSDNTAPYFTELPGDMEIECTDEIPDVELIALDNCTVFPVVGVSANTVETECGSIFTRSWFTADDCGNIAEHTQVITITDFTAPELSEYPGDLILMCGESLPEIPTITALDNCAGEVEVIFTEEISDFECGSVIRTWCATDCVGNGTCWSQTITFILPQDGLAPDQKGDGNESSLIVTKPSYNEALIVIAASNTAKSKLELFDITGHKLSQLMVSEMKSGEGKSVTFDTSSLSDGIYIIRFTNGSVVLSESMLIAN